MADKVSIELPASDLHSVLTVIKVAIKREREAGNTEFIEDLTLLYDQIHRQFEEEHGEGHVHGLYDDGDDA